MNLKKIKSIDFSRKIIVLVVLIAVAVAAVGIFQTNQQQKIDTTYLVSTLEKASELTTSKLTYTGMSKFEDSGIPFITKSNFIMVYKATARAGIDMQEVNIAVDNLSHIVHITVPKAKVLDVKVDASSIQFFDTKFALFNVNEKEDGVKAISLAEEEAIKEVANMGILEMADEQSVMLIKGIIQDAVSEKYKIEIEQQA